MRQLETTNADMKRKLTDLQKENEKLRSQLFNKEETKAIEDKYAYLRV